MILESQIGTLYNKNSRNSKERTLKAVREVGQVTFEGRVHQNKQILQHKPQKPGEFKSFSGPEKKCSLTQITMLKIILQN